MIKAIIFDCFGVLLVDSLHIMRKRLQASDPTKAQEVTDLIAMTNKGILSPAETKPKVAKLFGLKVEEYVQRVTSGEKRNKELLDYIPTLRTMYKTAMLSNVGSGSLKSRFSHSELKTLFDEVIASGDIGYAKPEARAYQITADRLGVRLEECLFTDDRESFCEAARSVGMRAIVFEDFRQFKRDLEALLSEVS